MRGTPGSIPAGCAMVREENTAILARLVKQGVAIKEIVRLTGGRV